jgi:hypothetical protein
MTSFRCNLRYRLWLLKNSFWSLIRVESGDQKCLEIREDRLYGIPAQSNFCWLGRVRVFQQPRLITTIDEVGQLPSVSNSTWNCDGE